LRGHALTLSSALGQGACPIALFTGDLEAADRFGAMLVEHSERHALHLWHGWARCFLGVVQVKRGDVARGLPALNAEIARIGDGIGLPRYLLLLGELAVCLGQAGKTEQALQAVDTAITRCERNEELWCIAELHRVRGELLLLAGRVGADDAFRESLDWSQRQGTVSWEVRAATSLARYQHESGQTTTARELLSKVYGRFTEGFETADLKTAKALMAHLRQ
jgi:predicted ATPase